MGNVCTLLAKLKNASVFLSNDLVLNESILYKCLLISVVESRKRGCTFVFKYRSVQEEVGLQAAVNVTRHWWENCAAA